MKYCNKCGHELEGKEKFCQKCGYDLKHREESKSEKAKEKISKSIKCHKCGYKNKKEAQFCGECGEKLDINHIAHEKEKHHRTFKIKSIHIAIMLFIIIIGLLLPTKIISYEVEVPYMATEQYTEEVPYEDIEEYTEQVPYETTEEYVESVPYTEQECTFFGLICNDITKYKDVIKTKPVTKYREETKYRKVTKTRTEVREREVQKIRIETRYKEVNWLFGFDAIIKFRDLNKYG